jgi:hypothetical protein
MNFKMTSKSHCLNRQLKSALKSRGLLTKVQEAAVIKKARKDTRVASGSGKRMKWSFVSAAGLTTRRPAT